MRVRIYEPATARRAAHRWRPRQGIDEPRLTKLANDLAVAVRRSSPPKSTPAALDLASDDVPRRT
jgi:hypothetical protein